MAPGTQVQPYRLSFLASGVFLLAALFSGFLGWRGAQQAPIIVDWETASELDTAGFNLYRSEQAEGPFERINPSLIPASPDPLVGGEYSYTDREVEVGRVYYYRLEEVETSGKTTQTGPIEVKTEGGGKVELVLSVVLLILACFSAYQAYAQARSRRPALVSMQS
jgi:hypothetical protein